MATNPPFPIVGIGASAGGLQALEQFFSHTPADSGMAFVVVQHRDPHRPGMLVELLQRQTPMPVAEATDQTPVEPGHVYVIPPGRDLEIAQGRLQLLQPVQARGMHMAIDLFFKSLADDRQHNCIGVVLSGMGTDGTLGLRDIRQAAGACFVQDPKDAQFDSMPRSAIAAGVADAIAPASELPEKIIAYAVLRQTGQVAAGLAKSQADQEAPQSPEQAGFLEQVMVLLRTRTGHDFALYKRSAIARRVERRMGLHQLVRVEDYLRYLRENPQESQVLFNELLIGVTSFFRDAALWDQLRDEVIPALLANHPDGGVLRAWVAGCATGEEAYSLAMVFREALDKAKPAQTYALQIFASDLDEDAIATARTGVYTRSLVAPLSEQRLSRFFVDETGAYRVCDSIRDMVIFARHDLIANPPFTRLDLVSCRNVLIYLESQAKVKLMEMFHYILRPGGVLVLGGAESADATQLRFDPVPGNACIYRRLDHPQRARLSDFPGAARMPQRKNPSSIPGLQVSMEKLVLERYAPAAVLVTEQGDVLYFSGKTGKYLQLAKGEPDLNLFVMAREGFSEVLREALARAVREATVVTLQKQKITGGGAADLWVDVLVQPLSEPPALSGKVLVVFRDVDAALPHGPDSLAAPAATATGSAQFKAMAEALQHARDDARLAREAMQVTQEELKSSNEELQSANEELQSLNEELTTSKDELLSMNEELQVVNAELQSKAAAALRLSNDMKNLLDSTEIAALFVDDALRVRRFTPKTTDIIKLIAADVGRPFTDIVSDLRYPDMARDAQEVLRTLLFREVEVPTADERWFRVRTMPYRTQEHRVDGLVITFMDVTARKKLEHSASTQGS